MNNDARKADLQKAVVEWKKKRRIHDDDPLMAALELWEILIGNTQTDPSQLFRHELEQLTEIKLNHFPNRAAN